jgi:acyl carrier protein
MTVSERGPLPTREQVRARLAQFLCEIARIPAHAISDAATIDHELSMESVAFIEIQVAIEDEYNIQLDPIYLVELNAFGAIVDHICACVQQTAA